MCVVFVREYLHSYLQFRNGRERKTTTTTTKPPERIQEKQGKYLESLTLFKKIELSVHKRAHIA